MSSLKNYPQIKIISELANKQKVGVYLVGGFLRDHLLDIQGWDFDFAVEKNAIRFARSFARKIKGAFVLLDSDHGCARVVKKTETKIQTYDFADFRADTLNGDLLHRDFTINTLFCPIDAATLKAPLNEVITDKTKALSDLKKRRIRMVSDKAFKEDPLRLLRAYSLKAILGFTIDPKTKAQIKKDKKLIQDVSWERIRDELFKILSSDRTSKVLKAMDKIGILDQIIPQIRVMYNVTHGPYHHLDIWPHSMQSVIELEGIYGQLKDNVELQSYLAECLGGQRSRKALIKLAALLHDIGKPESRRKEKGKLFFYGHERAGRNIVRNIAIKLKLSNDERRALQDMVLWHLRPGYLSNFQKPSERSLFRYFRDTRQEAVSIAVLSLADQRSTRGPLTTEKEQRHHQKICLNLIERYFVKQKEKPFVRLINGDDLIKQLKLKPSPLFGKILKEIEEQQAAGKIRTKRQALDLSKKIAQKKKAKK